MTHTSVRRSESGEARSAATGLTAELDAAIAGIIAELGLPTEFPAGVEDEARDAAERVAVPETDLSGSEFITIDPEGATDLDQAVCISRSGDGYRLLYAIADVPAYVEPGGNVDAEARRRGQTLYLPENRIPLHPTVISEGAASLFAGQDRSAFVWDFLLDSNAAVLSVSVARARVRNREQWSYEDAQQSLDSDAPDPTLALLREIGRGRQALELQRGGASLNRTEQTVVKQNGSLTLERRQTLPIERWNAQVSLMTGMAAADIMLTGRIGLLRTMPAADDDALARFRRQTVALGFPWHPNIPYGEYLASLDPAEPRHRAIQHAASSLFRGAGYTVVSGERPESVIQAAIGAPYAHTTAPLRRLVDRFALVICEALCAGNQPPSWVVEALPTLPKLMSSSDQLASTLDRRILDSVEAALLAPHVGEEFTATVISAKQGRGTIQLVEPAVDVSCEGDLVAGTTVRAVLVTATVATGEVLFRAV